MTFKNYFFHSDVQHSDILSSELSARSRRTPPLRRSIIYFDSVQCNVLILQNELCFESWGPGVSSAPDNYRAGTWFCYFSLTKQQTTADNNKIQHVFCVLLSFRIKVFRHLMCFILILRQFIINFTWLFWFIVPFFTKFKETPRDFPSASCTVYLRKILNFRTQLKETINKIMY